MFLAILALVVVVVACSIPAVLEQPGFWLVVTAAVVARLLGFACQAYLGYRDDRRAAEAARRGAAAADSLRHLTADDREWLNKYGWPEQ